MSWVLQGPTTRNTGPNGFVRAVLLGNRGTFSSVVHVVNVSHLSSIDICMNVVWLTCNRYQVSSCCTRIYFSSKTALYFSWAQSSALSICYKCTDNHQTIYDLLIVGRKSQDQERRGVLSADLGLGKERIAVSWLLLWLMDSRHDHSIYRNRAKHMVLHLRCQRSYQRVSGLEAHQGQQPLFSHWCVPLPDNSRNFEIHGSIWRSKWYCLIPVPQVRLYDKSMNVGKSVVAMYWEDWKKWEAECLFSLLEQWHWWSGALFEVNICVYCAVCYSRCYTAGSEIQRQRLNLRNTE